MKVCISAASGIFTFFIYSIRVCKFLTLSITVQCCISTLYLKPKHKV